MKKLSIIVIAFILPLLGLLTSVNAGVQSRKSAVQYYQHDAQKGRKLL